VNYLQVSYKETSQMSPAGSASDWGPRERDANPSHREFAYFCPGVPLAVVGLNLRCVADRVDRSAWSKSEQSVDSQCTSWV
jgi:hypothetical protein